MTGVDTELRKALTDGRRVLWGGARPPLPGLVPAPEIYDRDSDFRLTPEHHGAYDLVFLVDEDLGYLKHWPLVVDEALRALQDRGRLVLRFTQGPFASIFEFMSLVHQRTQGRARPVTYRNWPNQRDTFVVELEVERAEPRPAPRPSMTFGVITDGRRPDLVQNFVRSVLELDGLRDVEYEILVCGPTGSVLEEWGHGDSVKLVEQPSSFTREGWITRKKNLLVQASSCDVVVVAHDRYELRNDFLTELHRFGSDFSVLVCRQETQEGHRFPDWVTTGSEWSWSGVGMLAYGDYEPNMYVNGGIMIARRDVLERFPWNELLFWNQAEDVELSRRMRSAGIIPRLARHVVARTRLSRADQMSAFEYIPADRHTYRAPGRSVPHLALGRRVDASVGVQRLAFDDGLVLWPGWSGEDGDLPTWDAPGDPELSILPRYDICGDVDYVLRLEFADARQRDLCVGVNLNGTELQVLRLESDGDSWLSALWPHDLVPPRHSARIRIERATGEPVQLRSFEIDVRDEDRIAPGETLSLATAEPGTALYRDSWGTPEPWGSWSIGPRARLRFPVATPENRRALRLGIKAMSLIPEGSGPQRVLVSAGDRELGVLSFREASTITDFQVVCPLALVRHGWLDLDFVVERPVRPDLLGINPRDPRPLGVGVASITVKD